MCLLDGGGLVECSRGAVGHRGGAGGDVGGDVGGGPGGGGAPEELRPASELQLRLLRLFHFFR